MDESERMLLRRRKQFIAESIELSDELVEDLRDVGLLTGDVIAMLNLEKSNATKVIRFVEHIVAGKIPEAFTLFCNALAKYYKWLARDLRADLKVERGEVKPQPEAVQEAAALVHSRFGTSKRFSETDKKEMAELIAVRLQIAEDEWKAEIDKVSELLSESERRLADRDHQAKTLAGLQRDFVLRHEKQLVTHAHDMTTTREFLRRLLAEAEEEQRTAAATPSGDRKPSDINPLVAVRNNTERLLKQISFALNQRESLFYEKEKCLKLLGISDPKTALDEAVSQATGLNFANADLVVEDKTVTIRKLRHRVEELEEEVELVGGDVDNLRHQLDERDREISKLRRMVTID